MTLFTFQSMDTMKFYLAGFVFIVLMACNSKPDKEEEIANIPMTFEFERFDQIFSETTIDELQALKERYPIFFPEQYADSIWELRLSDTLQLELQHEVSKAFPDETNLKWDLLNLFQHIKFYFHEFQAPIVYATTSYVDYKNKVILTDRYLVIALDTYLGEEHPFYEGIQKYITKNLTASQIIPDVATSYARTYIARPAQRTLLAQMIYYGKELYLKDLWLATSSDAIKIGYTEDELLWVKENEMDMWRYFVENELLFSTNATLSQRFINPAPFSKFYLEIDNESPGMTGRYLGWQIVRAYMENNPVSIQQLMIMEADEIFKNSKYKPKL